MRESIYKSNKKTTLPFFLSNMAINICLSRSTLYIYKVLFNKENYEKK